MNDKNIKLEDTEKISGGVSEAANGAFWLNNDEAEILTNAGYRLSFIGGLPGWGGVEVGTVDDDEVTYQVNNPQNQRVRNVSELINVINRANNENH